jgi:hypothetical protein
LAPSDCQNSFDAAAGETRALMPLILAGVLQGTLQNTPL